LRLLENTLVQNVCELWGASLTWEKTERAIAAGEMGDLPSDIHMLVDSVCTCSEMHISDVFLGTSGTKGCTAFVLE